MEENSENIEEAPTEETPTEETPTEETPTEETPTEETPTEETPTEDEPSLLGAMEAEAENVVDAVEEAFEVILDGVGLCHVGHNGKDISLQRGTKISVSPAVYEILQRAGEVK